MKNKNVFILIAVAVVVYFIYSQNKKKAETTEITETTEEPEGYYLQQAFPTQPISVIPAHHISIGVRQPTVRTPTIARTPVGINTAIKTIANKMRFF